ncbi:hypothetical protein FEM33_20550 [Dyadobacter flavalbus]|uniref:Uncharacterized protein n=1 Tax=Dyadobacter flavalbus TaxID=2579942 RepID=A0A5M8QNG5_9BACT|nr:hypothetical protein [Dyadobacter flavalbus]KAA6436808.1 hypothetical protein FEM33_20550 [Dyadobacter flavalbus]
MKTRIVLILLSIFFCVLNVAQGQDSLYLTVEKLFALAESNSGQLKLDAIRIQDAEAGIVNAFLYNNQLTI